MPQTYRVFVTPAWTELRRLLYSAASSSASWTNASMKECPRCFACYDDERDVCALDASSLERSLDGPPLIDETYLLGAKLGQGGMGVVFRARHLSLQREFALKLIRTHGEWKPRDVERFRLEARALGRLKHEHIVDVTDFGVDPRGGGVPYLVMELLVGESLEDHCKKAGPLPLEEAVEILDQIARGLDFAHSRATVHRDLKPANVFLCRDEVGQPRVKLVDFGVARLLGASRAAEVDSASIADAGNATPRASGGVTNSVAGTPPYMAPECLRRGEASVATDIYAMGVVAYEVLSGRRPFVGGQQDVVNGHLHVPPPRVTTLLPSLPNEIDDILLAPLAKDPARRPRRASDLASNLRAAARAARVREWRQGEAPGRLAIAAAVVTAVLVVSPWIGSARLLASWEGWTVDGRLALVEERAPDPRLLLVILDVASLQEDPTPLAEMAEPVARQIERLFGAGARGVALDLILPLAWSRSESFSRLVLRHADALTQAALASPKGEAIGIEAVQGVTTVALGQDKARALFGVVNVEEDPDGVTRRVALHHTGPLGLQDAWATRAAGTLLGRPPSAPPPCAEANAGETSSEYWLDHAVDWRLLRRLSWKDLAAAVDNQPGIFEGALVLIGAEFTGSGDESHRIPTRSGAPPAVPGIVVQALAVNTVLEGFPIRASCGRLLSALLTPVAMALFSGILLAVRPGGALLAVAGAGLAYSGVAVGTFLVAGTLLPVIVPLALLALGSALSLAVRTRLRPSPATGAIVALSPVVETQAASPVEPDSEATTWEGNRKR